MNATLVGLISLGLVIKVSETRINRYRINEQHIALPGVSMLLDSRNKLITHVRTRCRTLAPATSIVALALPDQERLRHGAHFVVVHDDTTGPAALTALLEVLTEEVPILVGGQTTVDTMSRTELEQLVREKDPVTTEVWFRSLTVHGPDLSRLLLDLTAAVAGGEGDRTGDPS
ncbi:hypothetical protein ASF62_10915 [Leifsonia sp. Leaf325]|nr:hypothetical protein ASF62_10915 [Leifsonia sp. Leaf325]